MLCVLVHKLKEKYARDVDLGKGIRRPGVPGAVCKDRNAGMEPKGGGGRASEGRRGSGRECGL